MFLFDVTVSGGEKPVTLERLKKLKGIWSISGPAEQVYCYGAMDGKYRLPDYIKNILSLMDSDQKFYYKKSEENSSFHLILVEGSKKLPLSVIKKILVEGKEYETFTSWLWIGEDIWKLSRFDEIFKNSKSISWLLDLEKGQLEKELLEKKEFQEKALRFKEKFFSRPITSENISEFSMEYSAIEPGLRAQLNERINTFIILGSKADVGRFVELVASVAHTEHGWPLVALTMDAIANYGKTSLTLETLAMLSLSVQKEEGGSEKMKQFVGLLEKLAERKRICPELLESGTANDSKAANGGAQTLLRAFNLSAKLLQLGVGKRIGASGMPASIQPNDKTVTKSKNVI